MESRLMYIELKTGYSDNGPAWIGKVEFSKSGQTIYFNNKAFKKCKTPGITSNFWDLETGEDYWISGIKKNGQDRHWAGFGKIMIDKDVVNEYLEIIEEQQLSKARYEIIHVDKNFDKKRFNELENSQSDK